MSFWGDYRGLTAIAGIGLTLAFFAPAPAQAQFWDWGSRPRYRSDPFRDFFGGFQRERGGGGGGGWDRGDGGGGADFSHAPGPAQKKPEATVPIVVLGDANADWLAYGLEDAFSEKPEIAIVRKHRTDSGLIRYDPRRDLDWAQVAREIIAAEKPKFIVMMIGNNDRQLIREKAPPVVRPPTGSKPAAAAAPQPAQPATPPPAPVDPEQQPPEQPAAQPPPNPTSEQARQASYGPWEFHSEKWEIAYIKRIDAAIAALKSAGVPVLWVGLPSQRGTKASADSSYLNEIYRSRADKAGITYVDIWDGFVDESGRFSPQGPDYEGQIRRLRSGDGVYFTKFGARKLAHYVEREIERHLVNRSVPVALPLPAEQGAAPAAPKPGAPSQRPAVGPVLPLTAFNAGSDELLGGGRNNRTAPTTDASASRVLTKGEPIPAPTGRADDFSWPRSSGVKIDTNLPPTPPSPPAAAPAADKLASDAGAQGQGAQGNRGPGQPQQQQQFRRPRSSGTEPFRLPFFLPFFR
jgi:hypothetical protein